MAAPHPPSTATLLPGGTSFCSRIRHAAANGSAKQASASVSDSGTCRSGSTSGQQGEQLVYSTYGGVKQENFAGAALLNG